MNVTPQNSLIAATLLVATLLLLTSCSATYDTSPHAITDPPSIGVVPLIVDRNEHARDVVIPYITATIGEKQVKLLFDTGCQTSLKLSKQVIKDIGAHYIDDYEYSYDAMGRLYKGQRFSINEMTIGNLTFENVRGVESWESNDAHIFSGDGTIGIGMFTSYSLWEIDFPNNQIQLRQPTHSIANDVRWHEADFSAEGIKSQAVMDGETFSLIWDTGASHSVITPQAVPQGSDRLKEWHNYQMFSPESISITGRQAASISFICLDMPGSPADAFIGAEFFASHKVVFDFENERVGTPSQ